ncbi:hypothetical protein D6D54_01180 [Spiroplasma poulsonii]|uniref:Uncharacterized protein n=1 Tax=Spiroplasma poulsonii TaxID=2138 RepID=A0A433ET96_9MOLU|nr:hypothetical protein [Spiroplasma poulsonii]RUP78113.1 hypothetical protein D6D54_01180 [Spiroplasma poulsonii]
MENIKICESGCHNLSRNFAKDFDFIKEFSTNSETKEIYKPYKQKDKNKNISNYRIHKSSMQKYNNCGQKIISYIRLLALLVKKLQIFVKKIIIEKYNFN